ncbi:hypothetical protein TCDM_09849 [Trypanosoma cruzi Dm28c]|uniref:Uncharacterized protein n=1 Tax=Trypanosoma cruzi Dm28c TaxID=1416333 RepID=V5BDH9_TRYCR|nr:hypothetical protein TCDM_09849 [Trypanosoma cruzi Dm28c]
MGERISTAIQREWHHHPRRSHSQQQQLTHTDTRNEKEEKCTGNTQRLPPIAAGVTAGVSLFTTRQHTPSNTHTQNNQRDAKGHGRSFQSPRAASSRFTVLSSSSHHPARPNNPSAYKPTAGDTHRHLQLLIGNQSTVFPGTLSHTTHWLHATNNTPVVRQQDTSRSPVLPLRKGRRSRNLVNACILSVHTAPQRFKHGMCVHVLVRLSAPTLVKQLCGTRESKESNGRERQIAHTQITHIITHTRSRGMGALNHNK